MSKPDTVFVAITFADDTVGVMAFVTKERTANGAVAWSRVASNITIDAEIEKTSLSFDKEKLPIKGWRPINPRDVPKDRTFRDALRDTGTKLSHDMPHARRIHMDHVRQARTEEFGSLDRAWMKATGQGDTAMAAIVEAKRQALRDAPLLLSTDTAKTVEELKAMWPEELPPRE